MVCRKCGTEIAEKAIICYKCGTATDIPGAGAAARRSSAARSVVPRWVWLVLAAAAVAAMWWRFR